MRKGLGQGLNALFQDNEIDLGAKSSSGFRMVRLSQIEPNKNQPRRNFEKDSLEELAASIAEHGVIQPLIVKELETGGYQIVAGERRWRAARMAGLVELPVIVSNYTSQQAAEIAMIENLQREDLNPLEEAQGLQMLIQEYSLTQEEVARRIGKSRSAVTNSLRLLSLPPSVLALVRDSKLSAGHARTLLALPDPSDIEKAALLAVEKGLSVRALEKLVKQMANKKQPKEGELSSAMFSFSDIESRLSEELGRKVRITSGKNKGKIEIEYYGADDFDSLVERILG